MNLSREAERCMEELDVEGMRRLHNHANPHLPQQNEADTLVSLHMARTATPSINRRLRFYSHRWLLDRGHPSLLPDHLKPSAERLYPSVAKSVGISYNISSTVFKPVQYLIQGAMEDAVRETYADGHMDEPDIVKARMFEMKDYTAQKLLGTLNLKRN